MRKALSFDDVLLVPDYSDIPSRDKVFLHTKVCGFPLSLPILSANMASVSGEVMVRALAKQGGLGVLDRTSIPPHIAHDIIRDAARDKLTVVGSVGSSGDDADYLAAKSASFLCIDVAHGHHQAVLDRAAYLIRIFSGLRLIIGNIATAGAAESIADAIPEKDHHRIAVKVGVGSGSLCSTRVQTGFGVPTFQSLLWITEVLDSTDISIIADGGIKTSGDIVKCLAAGADAVMLGSLLAGTEEAPGDVIKDDRTGNLYKVYRGSASFGVKKIHKGTTSYIEGAETLVSYKGSVIPILQGLAEGIRSGPSYNGSTSIHDLQLHHEFIEVSSSGMIESTPHGVNK